MKAVTSFVVLVTLVLVIGAIVSSGAGGAGQTGRTAQTYHDTWPTTVDTIRTDGHSMPLPVPLDRDTAHAMTGAGMAMIEMSEGMDATASLLVASGDPALIDLGEHWIQDARALSARGEWMIITATSDAMVHDPKNADALNLANLRANGVVMVAEGETMAQHGRAMVAQIHQLDMDGALNAVTREALVAQAEQLVADGEAMGRDGEQMVLVADRLERSLAS